MFCDLVGVRGLVKVASSGVVIVISCDAEAVPYVTVTDAEDVCETDIDTVTLDDCVVDCEDETDWEYDQVSDGVAVGVGGSERESVVLRVGVPIDFVEVGGIVCVGGGENVCVRVGGGVIVAVGVGGGLRVSVTDAESDMVPEVELETDCDIDCETDAETDMDTLVEIDSDTDEDGVCESVAVRVGGGDRVSEVVGDNDTDPDMLALTDTDTDVDVV